MVLLLALVAASKQAKALRIADRGNQLRPYIYFTFVFFTWICINDLANGTLAASESGGRGYVLDFVAKRIVPVLFLYCSVVLINRKHELEFIVACLTCVVGLSCIVAVLQYFNVPIARQLHEMFHPIWHQQLAAGIIDIYSDYDDQAVSGLSTFSVTFAYTILVTAPFALTLAFFSRFGSLVQVASISFCVLAVVCLFLCRSRSGVVGAGLSCASLAVIASMSFPEVNTRKFVQFTLMGGLIAGMVYLFLPFFSSESTVKYENFSKFETFLDTERFEFYPIAAGEILEHPIIGMGALPFSEKYTIVPHNTFLNAGIYYGILGGLIVAALHLYIAKYLWGMIRRKRPLLTTSWLTVGAQIALINYIWNGMTHNESVVTGGHIFYIAVSLMVTSGLLEIHEHSTASAHASEVDTISE
ncbi:MAG TPA: hypothetical protein DDW52_09465 [Planctomycetaceae bacterium]|nr:hypothetical protein [Planctomycetaceae bacterium]